MTKISEKLAKKIEEKYKELTEVEHVLLRPGMWVGSIKYEELIHFKNEWYPTNEDWHTMIMNMNNHASLHSIFNKISDIDKVVRCYIAANMIGYPKLKDYE